LTTGEPVVCHSCQQELIVSVHPHTGRDGDSTERGQSAGCQFSRNFRRIFVTVQFVPTELPVGAVELWLPNCLASRGPKRSIGPLAHPHSILGHRRSYARGGSHGQCFRAHLHSSGRYARTAPQQFDCPDCQFSPTVSIRLAVENWQSTTGSRTETVGLNWQSVTVELAVGRSHLYSHLY